MANAPSPPASLRAHSQELLDLPDDVQQDRSTVVIDGLTDTPWNDAAIRAGVLARMPNVKDVKFERIGV